MARLRYEGYFKIFSIVGFRSKTGSYNLGSVVAVQLYQGSEVKFRKPGTSSEEYKDLKYPETAFYLLEIVAYV